MITEIHKLHEMLVEAGIEHDYYSRNELFGEIDGIDWGWHIVVPFADGAKNIVSAVEGFGTYGYSDDLIEIMGLLTPEESKYDSVKGWLTAEEVFRRIKEALS